VSSLRLEIRQNQIPSFSSLFFHFTGFSRPLSRLCVLFFTLSFFCSSYFSPALEKAF